MRNESSRKTKGCLTPQEEYEIWMQLVCGETTVSAAAERARVDRATVAKLKTVARDGALRALAASRPGRRGKQRDIELQEACAEAERLRAALPTDPNSIEDEPVIDRPSTQVGRDCIRCGNDVLKS